MNFLDVRTVLLINILTNCLCTLVLLFLWIQNRRRFQGMFFWLIDFCFQTMALVLIGLRAGVREMTRGTGIVFGGFCLVSLIRLAVMLSGPQLDNDYFKSGLHDTLLIIAYQLLLILMRSSKNRPLTWASG